MALSNRAQTTEAFVANLNEFAGKTVARMSITLQEFLVGTVEKAMVLSPVKTGRFRASMRVSAGIPDTTAEPKRPDDFRSPIPRGQIDPEALAKVRLAADLIQGGGLLYISNNVPYAGVVEFGSPPRRDPVPVFQMTAEVTPNILVRAANIARSAI